MLCQQRCPICLRVGGLQTVLIQHMTGVTRRPSSLPFHVSLEQSVHPPFSKMCVCEFGDREEKGDSGKRKAAGITEFSPRKPSARLFF